jgi:hypothetical protein
VKNQLFITGCIRSGTNWVFGILSRHYVYTYSEYFEYLDLAKRKKEFLGKNYLLFKLNEDMRNISCLEQAFPDGKILIVLRNPLEILHSIYKPNKQSKPYRPFHDLREKWSRVGEKDLLPAAVRRFESYYPVKTVNIIAKYNKNIYILKYEDLITNFNSAINQVFEFCKIVQNNNFENELLPIKTPNQGICLNDFSLQNQKIILSSRIPSLCKLFNYPLG